MVVPILIGYYRYSDIVFEWAQVIEDKHSQAALRAFLHRECLTSPMNPLRGDTDKGLELYMGTLNNGQQRLLFSSAQIEYIRYYLHAMGLTKSKLPIPSSEYLLTQSSLRNVASVFYSNQEALKLALRNVDKNNRRLKGTDSGLMSMRQSFERTRSFWSEKTGTYLAIDFEAWEMDHTILTECGWSFVKWEDGEEATGRGHFIAKENMIYTNGKYVPNMRDKYNFGESQIISKATFKQRICDMITDFSKHGPLYLVFHDCSQDIKYLKESICAPIEGLMYHLPDFAPDNGIFVIDTSDMFSALQGDIGEKRSLEKMCNLLRIENENAHNAGNDAHYTLLALKSMTSGNQLDAQREERWPNHTEPAPTGAVSMKVKFDPWDEESDFSDMEGAFSRPAVPREPVEKDMNALALSGDDDL